MELICSDTNVWMDYNAIGQIGLPFRLDCRYLIPKDTFEEEFLSETAVILRNTLKEKGICPVDVTDEEFVLILDFEGKYKRLSYYDRQALAIAKKRGIPLLTGDMALRKAAEEEGVSLLGSIGILDKLWNQGLVAKEEYAQCLEMFYEMSGGVVRLPKQELKKRIDELSQKG